MANKSTKLSKLERSQRAHERLNRKYNFDLPSSARNRAYGNYHANVMDRQRAAGKVLPKSERESIFRWWWNYEHK